MRPYGFTVIDYKFRDYDRTVYGKRTAYYRRWFRPTKTIRRAFAKRARQDSRRRILEGID